MLIEYFNRDFIESNGMPHKSGFLVRNIENYIYEYCKFTSMIKVKTFPQTLKIFETMKELNELDERVTNFIKENNIKKVISVSDATTSSERGTTIGIIRVMTYEE